ncbi:hypothetical protein J4211_05055 [Candidatus Woesearchaeota archaeon]|nr:hypothetical protein [Candidatus Woesearchaeota archaeon]
MKRGKATRDVHHANKEFEEAVKFLYKSTEDYLHAALELAKLQGSKKLRKVKPHILQIAKQADELYKTHVRKK